MVKLKDSVPLQSSVFQYFQSLYFSIVGKYVNSNDFNKVTTV